MEIIRHEDLGGDFKKLQKFPASVESLEKWERLFVAKGMQETPGIKQYPGFGSLKIYKARVIPLKENIGKSGGYRVIFQCLRPDCYQVLAFSRHGVYHDEQDLLNLIRLRLKTQKKLVT